MKIHLNAFLFFLIIYFVVSLDSFSQEKLKRFEYTSKNKKALNFFEEGKRCYDSRKDKEAEIYFLKSIQEDPNFVEPHVIISILCLEQNRMKDRIFHLNEAIRIAPKLYEENYFNLAETEFDIEDYESAKIHYLQFLKFTSINLNDRDESEFKLKCIEFAIAAKKNPKKITFYNMGKSINSSENEYFPTITADEKYFIYTRKLPCKNCISKEQEDLFISKIDDAGTWANSKQIIELSSIGNEGAPSISADGNYMFMTISQEMDGMYMGGQAQGMGSCDIFFTQKINEKWTKPVNLGSKINTNMWESQPSFSSDGKTLYFVRGIPARNGSVRDIDIYMAQIDSNGKFSQAVKLPSTINTKKEEQSVFIHPDNQTLYFSSKGHVGMGGADIFMSRKKTDGSWSEAINLGYPINTGKDENSLLVSPSGRFAYFASDREGGIGNIDLYQFEVPETMQPEKITYIKGKVFNAKTNEPLMANFELHDLEKQQQVTNSFSQKNGEFLVTLTANKNYLVNVNKEGFLFYSDNFSLKGKVADFNKPFQINIPLEPIDTGISIELKNVFFDINKWDLKEDSKIELAKLGNFLIKNFKLKIELNGHTDNTGDRKTNMTLSLNRAKSVYDYLINTFKINPSRLSFKGYADLKPKVKNDSPENKVLNRRTEFKVLSK